MKTQAEKKFGVTLESVKSLNLLKVPSSNKALLLRPVNKEEDSHGFLWAGGWGRRTKQLLGAAEPLTGCVRLARSVLRRSGGGRAFRKTKTAEVGVLALQCLQTTDSS